MSEYKKRLNIISQTINDTRYIKDSYIPLSGIVKILKLWFVMFTLSVLSFYTIDKLNMSYELYNHPTFYSIYNTYRILICIIIPLFLYMYISKSDISLKERRFLKVGLIFPSLLCLDNCLSSISSILNADLMISFYQSFPVSGIINVIFLFYLYSYFKHKSIIALVSVYIVYLTCSFYYLSIYYNLTQSSDFQSNIFMILNSFQLYRVIEILTLLLAIIIFNRRQTSNYES